MCDPSIGGYDLSYDERESCYLNAQEHTHGDTNTKKLMHGDKKLAIGHAEYHCI